ncbi:TIGR03086 family metal-binding protein [Actinoplanes sp. CA-252034]|uniref:TIGR03086 family metal-binding protein n=1 Tax=Actinoplanes sp. CA-252034 TaxID=3239906 RepID=UPI003D9928FE
MDDRDLAAPTPCPEWTVAALLDHLMGLSVAFTMAARKRAGVPGSDGPPPQPSAAHLSPHWRSRLPVLLADLSIAWRDPAAWTGTALAGGVTLPATAMGAVAMNELIMHGWDLARATEQDYAADPRALEVLVEFLGQGPADGTPGLFGPGSRSIPRRTSCSGQSAWPVETQPGDHPAAAPPRPTPEPAADVAPGTNAAAWRLTPAFHPVPDPLCGPPFAASP